MTHTPGPWLADHEGGFIVLNGSHAYSIRDICSDDRGWNAEDLDLLAAAPELLAALKAHLPWQDEPVQGWGCWADAVAAINKAEGRSE